MDKHGPNQRGVKRKARRRAASSSGMSLKQRAKLPRRVERTRPQNSRMGMHLWGIAQEVEDPVEYEWLSRTAGRVLRCGVPFGEGEETFVMRCEMPKLCEYCARVGAWKYGRETAAKALVLLQRNPALRFWFVTLTMPPDTDLPEQYRLFRSSLTKLRRKKTGQWPNVLAAVVQLHADRVGFLWRLHGHALVCAEPENGFDAQELLRDWAECAFGLEPRARSGSPDPGLLRATARQDARLLDCFRRLRGPVGIEQSTDREDFVRDVFNTVSYGGKPSSLTSRARLWLHQEGRRMRAPYGQMRAPHVAGKELAQARGEVAELLSRHRK